MPSASEAANFCRPYGEPHGVERYKDGMRLAGLPE